MPENTRMKHLIETAKPERLVRLPNFSHFLRSPGFGDISDELENLLIDDFVSGKLSDESALMQAFDASRYGHKSPHDRNG